MGGGGGGTFHSRSPEDLAKQVRKAEDQTSIAEFEAKLSGMLGELLATINSRDINLVRERLDIVKDALQGVIDGSFDQLFGGSVAKHTYVDGLSDIDSLVLINGSGLENQSPQTVLNHLRDIISQQLGHVAELSQGRMAITLQFPDGMKLQVLPAIKGEDGKLHVPSSRRDGWSKINPETFREALTRRNQECGSKLVPTIKLAKAIIGELPESQRLSGYHVESLAIAAFRNYAGEKTTSAMLPAFFERARDLVQAPIRDSTGQSVHVDEYLGSTGSAERIAASHILGRIAKRMRNASAAGSTAQWLTIFGYDE